MQYNVKLFFKTTSFDAVSRSATLERKKAIFIGGVFQQLPAFQQKIKQLFFGILQDWLRHV